MSAGICRECGCTDDEPCLSEDGACSWIDEDEDVCSSCAEELAFHDAVARVERAEGLVFDARSGLYLPPGVRR